MNILLFQFVLHFFSFPVAQQLVRGLLWKIQATAAMC